MSPGSGAALSRGFGSSFNIVVEDDLTGAEGGHAARLHGDTANSSKGNGNGSIKGSVAKLTDIEQQEFANASAATLAVFDSACQALMYVLCYRMADVLREGGEPAQALRQLPLRAILYSKLHPLHTCLPSVVGEFLHRAVAAGIDGFDKPLLDQHKREKCDREAVAAGTGSGAGADRTANGGGGNPGQDCGSGGGDGGGGKMARTSAAAVLGSDLAEAVRQLHIQHTSS
jgi:RNA polymerase I-specific transcription initiation factor RRN3